MCEWRAAMRRRRRSPILLFDKAVSASLLAIAPERAGDLDQMLAVHNFHIEIVDEDKFGVRVILATHKIYLPIAAMEYVWAQCLRFWVVTQEYQAAQTASPPGG